MASYSRMQVLNLNLNYVKGVEARPSNNMCKGWRPCLVEEQSGCATGPAQDGGDLGPDRASHGGAHSLGDGYGQSLPRYAVYQTTLLPSMWAVKSLTRSSEQRLLVYGYQGHCPPPLFPSVVVLQRTD